MKMKHLTLLFALLLCQALAAQVKIGDNPENINPASLLELESTDQVLVITRITTAQMASITPSNGALIYNTSENCLFYYDGQRWINLCEALGLSFTNDPIVNRDSTIIITEFEDRINFEVGQIIGGDDRDTQNNIEDFSIVGRDIRLNSISDGQLAPNSVGNSEMQDNAITGAEIDLNLVRVSTFDNDAGYLTAIELVADSVQYDPSASGLLATNVQNAIDEIDIALDTIALVDLGDGTYEFTNSVGNVTQITTNGLTISDTIPGNQIATLTLADGSGAVINETITSLSDNGDGLVTYTTEDGRTESVPKATLIDPGDGTYTFSNNNESDVTFDLNANALPFDNTSNGFTATNVQAAVEEVQAASSDDQNLTGNPLDETNTLRIDIENGDAATVNLSQLRQNLSDVLIQGSDAGGLIINNLLDPENPQDAATRNFVEDAINDLIVSGGGDAPNEYNEAFEVVGDSLQIRDAETSFSVGLNEINTNTTNANFAVVGTDLVITDSDGGQVVVALADIAALTDTDTNTTNTDFAVVGTDLVITDSDGGQVAVALADIAALTDTDTNTTNADFAVVGTDLVITDSDGGQITVALADIAALTDTDTNTTNTDFAVVGTNLIITDSDGGQVAVALADLAVVIDTNTQLDEDAVDTFVANNGFLTNVITDGITILGDGFGTPLSVGVISGGPDGNIATNSITQGDIDTDAVGNGELIDNSVGESELQDEAVTPAKIQPGAEGEILTSSGGTVAWSAPSIKAWAKVPAGGGIPLKGSGIANVVLNNQGSYTVIFDTPLPDGDYTIQLSVIGNFRIWAENPVNTEFDVGIWDQSNSPANTTFFVTIFDTN